MTAPGPGDRVPFLSGPRIHLRGLQEGDAAGPYLNWFNDEQVSSGNSHHVYPFTERDALEFIRHQANNKQDLVLAVVLRSDGRHIGNVALERIHVTDRSADFAIVIGDKSTWGKGYGTEAAELICQHGFDVLNLHRIACGTFAHNEAMIKLARRLGMRQEGLRREAVYKSGRYVDVLEFGVLKDEFTKRRIDSAKKS